MLAIMSDEADNSPPLEPQSRNRQLERVTVDCRSRIIAPRHEMIEHFRGCRESKIDPEISIADPEGKGKSNGCVQYVCAILYFEARPKANQRKTIGKARLSIRNLRSGNVSQIERASDWGMSTAENS
jgi:hypothetical protein